MTNIPNILAVGFVAILTLTILGLLMRALTGLIVGIFIRFWSRRDNNKDMSKRVTDNLKWVNFYD